MLHHLVNGPVPDGQTRKFRWTTVIATDGAINVSKSDPALRIRYFMPNGDEAPLRSAPLM